MAVYPMQLLIQLSTLLLGLQVVAGLAPRPNPSVLKVKQHSSKAVERRSFFTTSLQSLLLTAGPLLTTTAAAPNAAFASVTDETDTFGDNWWTTGTPDSSTATTSDAITATRPQQQQQQSATLASDEVAIAITLKDLKQARGLGLELGDIQFRTNRRVVVKSIQPNSLAERLGIQKDWVIIGLNGQSTERTDAQGVALMLSTAVRSDTAVIEFRFRDPAVFRERLQNLSAAEEQTVTTQVAPAGDTTQRNQDGSVRAGRKVTEQVDQKVTVSQIVPPKLCNSGATTDDLMEISYMGTVVETGEIFDGSAVMINGQGIPGRGNDVSLYFVLGKQPFGQFPPGWDVGLVGMCVGERRRLIIPPGLAYGAVGVPKRNIPPAATLQYDITLVSLNGISTPQ